MAQGISLGNALVPFASGEALFIDARSEDAYEQGHIQSSVSMPAEDFVDLPTSRLEKLEGFADLIVYCDGANATLSTSLARHLTAAGLPARVLQGGFSVWVKNGLPVEPANLGADFGHDKNHCPSCDY